MQADAAEIANGCEAAAPAKPKRVRKPVVKPRLLSLTDLDQRTAIYRQVADEIAAIATDLGGVDLLSTSERGIIEDAALAGAMAHDLGARWLRGEPIQVAEFATLVNVRRRNLSEVGIRRQPRDLTPSLATYLAAHDASKIKAEPVRCAAVPPGGDASAANDDRTSEPLFDFPRCEPLP